MVLFEVSRERTANSKSKDLHREHRGKPEKNLRKIEALTAAAHLSWHQTKPLAEKSGCDDRRVL
jgi:hypothetical protein